LEKDHIISPFIDQINNCYFYGNFSRHSWKN